ncbi:unnamed protein product [Caenorhabditis sp. 36 PRJEB53466]|nr:unnamed protein product [Caenorhabditis sp. 36 PRJEB53466]
MEVDSVLRDVIASGSFTQPADHQKVFKDECAYCFKTPFWAGGLFVSLKSYHSFCREHAEYYANLTGDKLFVQMESTKKLEEENQGQEDRAADGEPTSKMTKLTIEAEPKYTYEDKYRVVVHPNYEAPISKEQAKEQGGEQLFDAIRVVEESTSAERLLMLTQRDNGWDEDVKLITKHENLVQLENGKRLARSGWTCEADGCGLAENLWLNLTDGAIRCGRSQYVAEGQMTRGNGHMQEYYAATGFPLVAKLGTISPELDLIDIYSYDEDDAVVNNNITRHLAHFGLNPFEMERTAKSTAEMELDMNQKWEWAKCCEDGVALESAYGPGNTGLVNIGSTCYLNSVLQVLYRIDSFRARFAENATEIFSKTPIDRLHTDFNAQFAKVFSAMLSGNYASEEDKEHNGIRPRQFKRTAAGNHPEFSTAKQQDTDEYIRHIIEKVSTNNRDDDPTDALKFTTWTRFEDCATQKVRYSVHEEVALHLPVTDALLVPIPESEGRFSVDMGAALRNYCNTQFVEGYRSPLTGEQKGATNTVTLKTFPDYLLVQVQKFTYTSAGTMKKLDVDFQVIEELDLAPFRGHGQLPHEQTLPDNIEPPVEIPGNVRAVANELMAMGFEEQACLRAAFTSNGNAEVATNWLMENLEDPGINDPFVMPKAGSTPSAHGHVDPNLVQNIVEMGFSEHQAKYALRQVTNVADAVEWLFGNMDQIPEEAPAEMAPPPPPTVARNPDKVYRDGSGRYKLIGMISHMGSRPDCGHYVAHVYKDGRWVLFNDEKVAISQEPPLKLAYQYLYERVAESL